MNDLALVVRVDANQKIGSGHFMRCLALAQAFKEQTGGSVTFITACQNNQLLSLLKQEDVAVRQLPGSYPENPDDQRLTKEFLLKQSKDSWVVLDGYHFDTEYQKQIKDLGFKLLVVDDMAHLDYYYADIILNQNLGAETLRYNCPKETKLLLGTEYTLLRKEFLKWRGYQRQIPKVAKKILVTMGGSDPHNATLKILQAVNEINVKDLEVKVVIGPDYTFADELKKFCQKSKINIAIEENANNMPELMAWADLAISGAGSTVWELLFMQVPVITVVLAENQEKVISLLKENGTIVCMGWHDKLNLEYLKQLTKTVIKNTAKRNEMIEKGKQVINNNTFLKLCKIF